MKKAILTICLACSVTALLGQALYLEYPSVYLKISTGAALPITRVLNGQITDPLVQFDDAYTYNKLSTGLFFGRHLGFELSFQTCTGENSNDGLRNFNTFLEEMYGDKYYITSTSRRPSYESFLDNGFDKFEISVIYRFNKGKFILMPGLSFGYTVIPLHSRDIILKERNSNNYKNIGFHAYDGYPSTFFTFGPGISIGRKVFNQLVLTLDIQYNWLNMDFDYEVKTHDLAENISITEIYPYSKNIHSLSIGIGLIYIIKYGKALNPDHPAAHRPSGRFEATDN